MNRGKLVLGLVTVVVIVTGWRLSVRFFSNHSLEHGESLSSDHGGSSPRPGPRESPTESATGDRKRALIRQKGTVVLVVDGQGRPRKDIPITLIWSGQSVTDGSQSTMMQAVGLTSEDGELFLDDMAERRASVAETMGTDLRCSASVCCIGVPDPTIELLGTAPERVTLIVPPSGSVTAELNDSDGRSVSQALEVVISVDTGEVPDLAVRSTYVFETEDIVRPVRIGPVALNRPFRVRGASAWLSLDEKALPGLRVDGEVMVVRWQAPDRCPTLTGVVLSDGQFAAKRTFLVHWTGDNLSSLAVRTLTDGRGRFWVIARPTDVGGRVDGVWLDEIREGGETSQRGWLERTIRLSVGSNDAGPVVLQDLPVIVRARVCDPEGNGIDGALLSIDPYPDVGATPWLQSGPVAKVMREVGGWVTYRGLTAIDQFVIEAQARGYVTSPPRRVHRGDRDVEFVLAAGRRTGK